MDSTSSPDPITAICDMAMRAFARTTEHYAADSPFARAKARLGDRYFDVAMAALKVRLKAALWGDGQKETMRSLGVCGELGAHAVMVGIVADTLTDIIEAAAPAPQPIP